MKRFFALLLAVCVVFSLAACKGTSTNNPYPSEMNGTVSSEATTGATQNTTSATESTTGQETITVSRPTEGTPSTETESTQPATPNQPTTPNESVTPTQPAKPTEPAKPSGSAHTHSYNSSITKVSCTQNGVKTFTCACGDSYTESIPATGHSWGQWKTIKEPTTSATGNSQRVCSNCNAAENKSIPKLPSGVPQGGLVTEAQLQKIEEHFLSLVNAERSKVGVSPLSINSHLDSCAKIRSAEIIQYFSHTRPDGQQFSTVVDENSYYYITLGENICMTSHMGDQPYGPEDKWVGTQAQIQSAATWMFNLFKNSPGHYANMIKTAYKDCGIGISYVMYNDIMPMFHIAHIFGSK